MLIQDRVKLIMQSNNESSSSFADKIGIKRSNLSHVLSGRNKPSLDFLEKIINFYPNVNASWLVTGKTRSGEFEASTTNVIETKELTNASEKESETNPTRKHSGQEEIEKVIVFYKNGNIKEYNYSNQ